MDRVIQPDGVVIEYPEGIDETAQSQEQQYPLRSKLIKQDGRKYYYKVVKALDKKK